MIYFIRNKIKLISVSILMILLLSITAFADNLKDLSTPYGVLRGTCGGNYSSGYCSAWSYLLNSNAVPALYTKCLAQNYWSGITLNSKSAIYYNSYSNLQYFYVTPQDLTVYGTHEIRAYSSYTIYTLEYSVW